MPAVIDRDTLLAGWYQPERIHHRLETLEESAAGRDAIAALSVQDFTALVKILAISDFLFRHLCCTPENITLIGKPPDPIEHTGSTDRKALLQHKYSNLLRIIALELTEQCSEQQTLQWLSALADTIIRCAGREIRQTCGSELPTMAGLALGKLGAMELNLSSDADLLFVCEESGTKIQDTCSDYIRRLVRMLENHCEDGFLYRVDLNLRPMGRRAALLLNIDSTEQYYEASKDAWERFAWLRARFLLGDTHLAKDLITRLQPFIYHRTLSMEEIEQFIALKKNMAAKRKQDGEWNVKLGEGGIRDIEFFVHLLQLLNGARFAQLQTTSTLTAMQKLHECGLLDKQECDSLTESYLFLRRLEHCLQMVDEQQTHSLPEDVSQRMRIVSAMSCSGENAEQKMEVFLTELARHRNFSKQCFARIFDYA